MMHPPEFLLVAGMIVAGTSIVRPLAKAMAVRLAGGSGGDDARVRELEAELRLNRQQLLETREHVDRMAEKVHFLENLLAEPAGAPQLPAGRR
jgi:hypothetical protein